LSSPDKREPKKELIVFTQEGCPPCPEYDKMARDAVPKDVVVREVQLGRNVDLDALVGSLGIDRTPAALYVEEKVIKVITPTGKVEEDRATIAKVGRADPAAGSSGDAQWGCQARYKTDADSWRVVLGPDCASEVMKATENLGPGAKKNVSQKFTSNDLTVRELLKRLSSGGKKMSK
jgi:hypothetical protein